MLIIIIRKIFSRSCAISLKASCGQVFLSYNWGISKNIPQFPKLHFLKNIWRIVNTVASIWGENVNVLFTGWEVRMGKKLCPRSWVLKTKGTVFSHMDWLSPVNNFFFPAVNWLYRLQMGLFRQLLSFNGLARHLPTICKKSLQQTSNSYIELLYVSCIYFTN